MSHCRVVALAADGVGLAPELLAEEVELAPHRPLRRAQLAEVGRVRGEPIDLLGHIDPLGELSDLLSEPLGIDGGERVGFEARSEALSEPLRRVFHPRVDVIARSGENLWRLQAGTLSKARAKEICAALISRGEACILVRG